MGIKKYLDVLTKNLWFIVLITFMVTGVTAYVNIFLISPTFQSKASIYVINKEIEDSKKSLQYDDIMVTKQLVKDYKVVATSSLMTNMVIDSLGLTDIDSTKLAKKITVSQVSDTNVMEISVKDKHPKMAQDIVDKLSSLFVENISNISSGKSVSVTIISKPELPSKPVRPLKLLNILVAFLSGITGTIGFLFVKEYLDSRIKTIEDVERYLQLNVLAVIPEEGLV
jgi:capsular polysaccharide biosynthesis protein